MGLTTAGNRGPVGGGTLGGGPTGGARGWAPCTWGGSCSLRPGSPRGATPAPATGTHWGSGRTGVRCGWLRVGSLQPTGAGSGVLPAQEVHPHRQERLCSHFCRPEGECCLLRQPSRRVVYPETFPGPGAHRAGAEGRGVTGSRGWSRGQRGPGGGMCGAHSVSRMGTGVPGAGRDRAEDPGPGRKATGLDVGGDSSPGRPELTATC